MKKILIIFATVFALTSYGTHLSENDLTVDDFRFELSGLDIINTQISTTNGVVTRIRNEFEPLNITEEKFILKAKLYNESGKDIQIWFNNTFDSLLPITTDSLAIIGGQSWAGGDDGFRPIHNQSDMIDFPKDSFIEIEFLEILNQPDLFGEYTELGFASVGLVRHNVSCRFINGVRVCEDERVADHIFDSRFGNSGVTRGILRINRHPFESSNTPVPEPATAALFVLGLTGLIIRKLCKK